MRILLLTADGEIAPLLLATLRAEHYQVTHQTAFIPAEANSLDLVLLEAELTATLDAEAFFCGLAWVGQPLLLLYNTARQPLALPFRDLPGVRYFKRAVPTAQLLREVACWEVKRYAGIDSTSLTLADLQLDVYEKTVTRAGKIIKLTLKEFRLLKILMLHKNRLVLRSNLLQQLWGTVTAKRQNSLTQYINYLRGKIDAGHTQQLLHTISGQGYMLRAD